MDDTIALLVGRVILAWGRLDQRVYAIANLLSSWQSFGAEEPDDRFKHRLKLIRRLVSYLTHGDQGILADFDRANTAIKELERKRAHLAHGSIAAESGIGIRVYDSRESRAHGDGFRELMEKDAEEEEFAKLRERHLNIKYSLADLESMVEEITNADFAVSTLLFRARTRSRELRNGKPPEH